jgi:hypothetical protein
MNQEAPKKKDSPLTRLESAEDMAVARFGVAEGLAIVRKTTLELADFYADKYGLDASDPEVNLTASALAFTRHKEFVLLREVERDLFNRVLSSASGQTYGEVFFAATRTGAFREVNREIDRLHNRGTAYLRELKELGREASRNQSS